MVCLRFVFARPQAVRICFQKYPPPTLLSELHALEQSPWAGLLREPSFVLAGEAPRLRDNTAARLPQNGLLLDLLSTLSLAD